MVYFYPAGNTLFLRLNNSHPKGFSDMATKISKIHSRVLAATQKKEVDEAGAVAFEALNAFYKVNSSQMQKIDEQLFNLLSNEQTLGKIEQLSAQESNKLAERINAYRRENSEFKKKMVETHELHKDRTGRPKTAEDMQLVHSCSHEYSKILEYYDSNVIPLTADISDIIYKEDTSAQDVSVVTDVVAKPAV